MNVLINILIAVTLSAIFLYVNKTHLVKNSKSKKVEKLYTDITKGMPSWSFLSVEKLNKLEPIIVIVAFAICVFIFYNNTDVSVVMIIVTGAFNLISRYRKKASAEPADEVNGDKPRD
jgi:predicted RND superfamily exporter protein